MKREYVPLMCPCLTMKISVPQLPASKTRSPFSILHQYKKKV